MGGTHDVIIGKGHSHRPTVGRWGRALHAFTPREAATEEETHPSAVPAFLLLLLLDIKEE